MQVPVAQVQVQVLMTGTRILVLVARMQVDRVPVAQHKYPCFGTQNVTYEF